MYKNIVFKKTTQERKGICKRVFCVRLYYLSAWSVWGLHL